jgi:hypothetical protein
MPFNAKVAKALGLEPHFECNTWFYMADRNGLTKSMPEPIPDYCGDEELLKKELTNYCLKHNRQWCVFMIPLKTKFYFQGQIYSTIEKDNDDFQCGDTECEALCYALIADSERKTNG